MAQRGLVGLVVSLLAIALLIQLPDASGQAENRIMTETGRFRLTLPDGWIMRLMPDEEEIMGLDSETLVLASSEAALDDFQQQRFFDGTVLFISAYPYHVYRESVLGFPVEMLSEVTVHDPAEITRTTFADFPAAEFLYMEDGFLFWDVLLDVGELTYRATAYSTHFDDYDQLQNILNSATFTTPGNLMRLDQPTRTIHSDDARLSFVIPQVWLYWIEGRNTLSFASSGHGYRGISYAFQPADMDEVAFVVQRFIKSALRGDELLPDGSANLPAIAERLRHENEGLRKEQAPAVHEWNGIPRLDSTWLVPGQERSLLTRTTFLDGQDVVYFIQAQYPAGRSAIYNPMIDQVMDSLRYTPPTSLIDTTVIGLQPGQTAPDFTLPLLDSGNVSLQDYRGQVVLINLWASWCGPCHDEAPFLQSLYEAYDGQFEILAVNVGETAYEANGFMRRYDLTFPILLDPDQRMAAQYELNAFPTTYIIGRDGVVLEMIRGSFTEQGLRDLLALYVGQLP